MSQDLKVAAERIRTALDLADMAAEMQEQRLRREQPELDDDEINARVAAWYRMRPGSKDGDAVGVPGVWPRRRDK